MYKRHRSDVIIVITWASLLFQFLCGLWIWFFLLTFALGSCRHFLKSGRLLEEASSGGWRRRRKESWLIISSIFLYRTRYLYKEQFLWRKIFISPSNLFVASAKTMKIWTTWYYNFIRLPPIVVTWKKKSVCCCE